MALQAGFHKEVFQFSFKARTSRGAMRDKVSWFIVIRDDARPGVAGIGECGPLPGLSVDDVPDFETVLHDTLGRFNVAQPSTLEALYGLIPAGFPSLTFGLETAWLDLQHGGRRVIFDSSFTRGDAIPINGLIWMGDLDFMMTQINQKVSQGFRCIKLKVGGLDFERECDVLSYIRKRYYREDVTLRLDANGAFKPEEALFKLRELSKFTIHSIEQPVKPGLAAMESICRESAIPVALDEELIGIDDDAAREALLMRVRPHYIILKPSLHGGFAGSRAWIALAERLGIGWWITSALESNIGLNAICQFTAGYGVTLPQGLGTGGIYENNIGSPLRVTEGSIRHDAGLAWHEEDVARILRGAE